jgi:hypothetical protein
MRLWRIFRVVFSETEGGSKFRTFAMRWRIVFFAVQVIFGIELLHENDDVALVVCEFAGGRRI